MNEQNQLNRWLPFVTMVALILSAIFIILGLFGYGKLVIDMPSGSIVTVNGHVKPNGALSLRPGSYTITVYSSMYSATPRTIHLNPFQSRTLTTNDLAKRDPTNIIRSVIGGYSGYGAPELLDAKYFENNTWLVGTIGPGAAQPVALHYERGAWNLIYFGDVGYEHDPANLPSTVGAYVNELLGELSNG